MTENRPAPSSGGPTVGYDHATGTFRTEHDWGGPDSLGNTLITAVAAVTGADPRRMAPLYDVVDPDALERLFAPLGTPIRVDGGRVELAYSGCEVTIYWNGRIVIQPPPAQTEH